MRWFPAALTEISRYLRDFRTEQVHDIDVALLDTLHALYTTFDARGNFEVISGYRSPRTNAALRHATSGVAENSLHIQGRAIDVRLTSAKTTALRDAALALQSRRRRLLRRVELRPPRYRQFRSW